MRGADGSSGKFAAFRERGDSAWGRVRYESKQKTLNLSEISAVEAPVAQSGPRRRFVSPCESYGRTVEASAQTTECTASVSDFGDDAQLFELRRVAHRAEAECAVARTAQKKASQAASAAESRCKESQRKAEELQKQVQPNSCRTYALQTQTAPQLYTNCMSLASCPSQRVMNPWHSLSALRGTARKHQVPERSEAARVSAPAAAEGDSISTGACTDT